MIQLASASVLLLPYVLLTAELKTMELTRLAVSMVLVLGLVHTAFACVLYCGSLQKLEAQSAAVLGYIGPISALILSELLLGEHLPLLDLLGAVMIIGEALVGEWTPEALVKDG